VGILDDKVALVTGASGGLGRASAQIFAREGARVVVVDTQHEGGEETVSLIKSAGGEAIFVAADMTCSSDAQAMVRAAIDAYGGLDCAVNNVDPCPHGETPEKEWPGSTEMKLTRALLCMKYEIPEMLKRGGGVIVNMGREDGAVPVIAFYISARLGLTKVATLDYDSRGIRANTDDGGAMWVPMTRLATGRNSRHLAYSKNISPIGRFAAPEGVAEAAVWLCTNVASFVFGHTLADGGAVVN